MPGLLTIRTKSKEWTHEIADDEAVIVGRSSRTDIQILDKAASGLHFEIRGADDEWMIKDLKSTNGTFLNGEKIESSPLSTGDVIKVGSVEIVFSSEEVADEIEEIDDQPDLPSDVEDETPPDVSDDETELAQAIKLPKKEPVEVLEELEEELEPLDEIEELDAPEADAIAAKKPKTEVTQKAKALEENEEEIIDLDEGEGGEAVPDTTHEEILNPEDDDDVEILEIE